LFAALALVSAAAIAVCYTNGWLLYYGDAEAHLNIARRIVDSRPPLRSGGHRVLPCRTGSCCLRAPALR